MEPVTFASFSLASILAALPMGSEPVSQSNITTHISPAIAGQWEIDLDSEVTMTKAAAASQKAKVQDERLNEASVEPSITADLAGGVIDQSEQRVVNIKPRTERPTPISAAKGSQCREIYNFGADNEMWAVSGDEWTYGRYLVTHREEGLPIIALKTIYDNNEVDCSGNQIDQTDEALIAFLHHDGNQMQWCADPEGTQCFMNFHRVLP